MLGILLTSSWLAPSGSTHPSEIPSDVAQVRPLLLQDHANAVTDAGTPVTAAPRVLAFLREQVRRGRGQEVGHQLLALCAPRLTFVSYGVPERGDAKWLDQQGSYMAAVAAQPVFRLLGARALGVSDDYMKEKMPPVNVGLLDGQLAWRQHDGGHTDGPNWKYFIPWADKFLKHASSATSLAK